MDACAEAFSIAELDTAEALKRLAGFSPQQLSVTDYGIGTNHFDNIYRQPAAVTGLVRKELVFVRRAQGDTSPSEYGREFFKFWYPFIMRSGYPCFNRLEVFSVKAP
ncbi:Uncharacterised protein [Klebsiella pneumoniae]|nr:Uncharacterised protein [Klebsiella pneumoniae]SAS09543.1 Uncharacterised protein [Klebsiella pneumoniae]SAV32275.1 Uncharacterised protein [Klebsiella pneumoniae]SBX98231.1 Uncharacterised protein [Klebsiella pneumoniae]SBY09821.1 Uncharacterised protein [Klebsiella pneumoniae]